MKVHMLYDRATICKIKLHDCGRCSAQQRIFLVGGMVTDIARYEGLGIIDRVDRDHQQNHHKKGLHLIIFIFSIWTQSHKVFVIV